MLRCENMLLSNIRTVLSGPVNDVAVCRDMASPSGKLYTLITVKETEDAKKILGVMENCPPLAAGSRSPFVLSFSQGENFYLLFDYQEERRLSHFMETQLNRPDLRETACLNFIAECMTCPLPAPILALVLTDINININQDYSVYFNTFIDLAALDAEATEETCANRGAVVVRRILSSLPERQLKKLKSFALLDKKINRQAYRTFSELYRDFRLTEIPPNKLTLWDRFKRFFFDRRDGFFRFLLVVCALLVLVALFLLISNVIFGSLAWLGFGNHVLEVIGTETLK